MPKPEAFDLDNHPEAALPALPIPGPYITPKRREDALRASTRVPRTSTPSGGPSAGIAGTPSYPIAEPYPRSARQNPLQVELDLEDEGVFETPNEGPEYESDNDSVALEHHMDRIVLGNIASALFVQYPSIRGERRLKLQQAAETVANQSIEATTSAYGGNSTSMTAIYADALRDLTREYLRRRTLSKSERGSATPSQVGTPRVLTPPPQAGNHPRAADTIDLSEFPPLDPNLSAAMLKLHALEQQPQETNSQYDRRRAAANRETRLRTPQPPHRKATVEDANDASDTSLDTNQHGRIDTRAVTAPPSTAPGILIPDKEAPRTPMCDNWKDRIIAQHNRDKDLKEKGISLIDDQGIRFENGKPRDYMRELFVAQQPREPTVDRQTAARMSAAAIRQRIKTEPLDERTPFVQPAPKEPSSPSKLQPRTRFASQRAQPQPAKPPSRAGQASNRRETPNQPNQDDRADEREPKDQGHLPATYAAPPALFGRMSEVPDYARSYAMPLPQRQSPVAEGVQLAFEFYRQRMHDRLKALIFERLGVRMVLPDGYKIRKGDGKSVGLYSGSQKFGDLEEWLTNLVVMLAVNQYGGTDRDAERILVTSEFLDGDARKWYNRHVIHVNRKHQFWTFEQVITGLYDRFIHASTMQDARTELKATQYNPAKGVQGFIDALDEQSQLMAQPPDDHTVLDTFLYGLPKHMREKLFSYGLSPEVNTIDDFTAYAIAYEAAAKTTNHYNSTANAPRSATERVQPQAPAAKPSRVYVRAKDIKRGYAPRAYVAPKRVNAGDNQREYRNEKQRSSTPFKSSPLRHEVKHGAKLGGQVDHQRQHQPGNHGSSTPTCFNCGEVGHMSYECKKPKKNRAFVRAAHTAAMDDGAEADDEQDREAIASPEDVQDIDRPESEPASESGDELIEVEVYDNEYYTRDNDTERAFAMTEAPIEDNQRPPAGRYKIILKKGTLKRPIYSAEDKECLVTYTNVGGQQAWTLWDSGSTTSGVTPAFTHVAGIKAQTLDTPLILQLGTTGSRATVNYGTETQVSVPGFDGIVYLDVANFDRYDVIIGTPFMRANNVVLNFATNEVIVNGVATPALRVKLEDTDGRLRRHRTLEKRQT